MLIFHDQRDKSGTGRLRWLFGGRFGRNVRALPSAPISLVPIQEDMDHGLSGKGVAVPD